MKNQIDARTVAGGEEASSGEGRVHQENAIRGAY